MAAVSIATNLSTLMPVLLGVTLVRFLVMGHYAVHRKVYPGFRTFVLAEFAVLLGMGAMALRAPFNDAPLLVLVTNIATLAHPVLVFHALGTFGRLPRLRARTRQNVILAVLVCLAQLADLLIAPDTARRVAVYSALTVLLNLRIGLELPFLNRRRQAGLTLVCATYFLAALIHAARFWDVLDKVGYGYTDMMLADGLLTLFIYFRIMQSVMELYAVFSINSQLLEQDLRVATAQIERMAQTDALTGALNRRGLELLGGESLRKSRLAGRPGAVIMLDLDWFKQVNDTMGHATGDELLRAVAALCSCSLREDDVFARYGGEEFVVVAPYTDAGEAERLAQRMRAAIEHSRFAATREAPVTASFGVASGNCGLDPLLRAADGALYAAKQAGRNRVVVAQEPCDAPGRPAALAAGQPTAGCPTGR